MEQIIPSVSVAVFRAQVKERFAWRVGAPPLAFSGPRLARFGGGLGTRRTTKVGDARSCLEWGAKKFRTMAVACVLRTHRCTCKCVGSFAVSASRCLLPPAKPRDQGKTLFAAMFDPVGGLVGYSCRHTRHCLLDTVAKLVVDDNTPRLHRRSWLIRTSMPYGYSLLPN